MSSISIISRLLFRKLWITYLFVLFSGHDPNRKWSLLWAMISLVCPLTRFHLLVVVLVSWEAAVIAEVLWHRGRNRIYSFHCLLGRPHRPQGCKKLRHYALNLDLEVWCSNIEPKLNECRTTSRSNQKRLIFGRISLFLQFWLSIRAPNLQIQV